MTQKSIKTFIRLLGYTVVPSVSWLVVMSLLAFLLLQYAPCRSISGSISGIMPANVVEKQTSVSADISSNEIILVNEAKAGIMEAFNTLVRRHEKQIFATSLYLVGNQADAYDVAQETFIAAFRKLSSFDGRSRFSTWLTSIAVNLSLNQLHKIKTSVLLPYDEAEIQGEMPAQATTETPLTLCQAQEDRTCLQNAIASLSDNHRAVIILRELHGYSYQEISRITGCSIGTVMSRLAYAREALKKKLFYKLKDGGETR